MLTNLKPAVGQLWRDNDPRTKGKRKVEIVERTAKVVKARNVETGHISEISVKRLLDGGAHGYTLVKKSKRGRKPVPKSKRRKLAGQRWFVPEYRAVMSLARRHAKGNLSAWLRHAGLNYKPRKGEKIVEER